MLLICVCTLFLNVLISVAAAAVILFLPQDFSRIFIKEAVLGAVAAVVILFLPQDFFRILMKEAVLGSVSAAALTADAVLAASFFILFRCGYDSVWKFMLFCLVIPQISAAFFSLMEVFSRKKIDYILFAGLVCLIFIKIIFFMNG